MYSRGMPTKIIESCYFHTGNGGLPGHGRRENVDDPDTNGDGGDRGGGHAPTTAGRPLFSTAKKNRPGREGFRGDRHIGAHGRKTGADFQ